MKKPHARTPAAGREADAARYTLSDGTELGVHPFAHTFPLMGSEEFEGLKRSIAVHGLEEPITLHEGIILDGRHRCRACLELGVTPTFAPWNGRGRPEDFIYAKNRNRRQLTKGQAALVDAAYANLHRVIAVGTVDTVRIVVGDRVVAEHRRCWGREQVNGPGTIPPRLR